jgi:hypothetical protein
VPARRRAKSLTVANRRFVVVVLTGLAAVLGTVLGLPRSDASGSRLTHRLRSPASQAPQLITVDPTIPGRAVPSGFLGLSIEYWALEAYAGQNASAVNPVLLQLIRNLGPAPILRIGGVTTDRTWWPIAGVKRPRGVNYNLSANRLAVMKSISDALGAHYVLGVNFEADSARLAAAEAAAQSAALGPSRIDGFELGNEPELYSSWGWYRSATGRGVPGRRRGYDFRTFVGDFARISSALPPGPVAGPASGSHLWLSSAAQLIAAAPRLRLLTAHLYPIAACDFPLNSPKYPTLSDLLSSHSSVALAQGVASDVSVVHARNLPFRIDEMNSVSCGSVSGLTHSFALALWSLDALFADVQVGVNGVNMHTYPGAAYELFRFNQSHGHWTGYVEPEYYGLLMFARAAPVGSHLLQVSGASGSIRAWATAAPDGQIRILVINDDTTHQRTVALRVPGTSVTGTLERLLAPGVRSTTGVTLGGQSFSRQTSSGLLAGSPHDETLLATLPGNYTIRLPAASAALLTLR